MIVQRAGAKRLFLPDMGISVVEPMGGAAVGNGLLNNLIAYWPGNEAAGNALDLHTNALHLTDVNTVTSNPGLVYALARQYTRLNSEYHARPGDDALLSAGDVDFTVAAWCWADSGPGGAAYFGIAGKWTGGTNTEYLLQWRGPSDRLTFHVNGGGTAGLILADTLGIPAINTWYLVVGWHDSVANTINIQVNGGGVDSVGHGAGVNDAVTPFSIGSFSAAYNCWNGRIGPTMFWKSAPGGGGVLTAAQRTALYNGGAGLPYAAFTV